MIILNDHLQPHCCIFPNPNMVLYWNFFMWYVKISNMHCYSRW